MRPEKVKELAAEMLNCGSNRIWFNPFELDKVKSVMTKDDLRALIKDGVVRKKKKHCQSRGRARILKAKKAKGRKKGFGKRSGKKNARMGTKRRWITRTRALRRELKKLQKQKPKAVNKIGYRKLYKMIKGNFFKGKKYLAGFVEGKKTKE